MPLLLRRQRTAVTWWLHEGKKDNKEAAKVQFNLKKNEHSLEKRDEPNANIRFYSCQRLYTSNRDDISLSKKCPADLNVADAEVTFLLYCRNRQFFQNICGIRAGK